MATTIHKTIQSKYLLSSDKNLIELNAVHQFLSRESYWAKGIAIEKVEQAIAHSQCLALYHDAALIGFGRMITDKSTFAYLCDVYVLEAYRGVGLGKALMAGFAQWADEFGLRRFLLTTQDAHSFYESCGWERVPWPERLMHRAL